MRPPYISENMGLILHNYKWHIIAVVMRPGGLDCVALFAGTAAGINLWLV